MLSWEGYEETPKQWGYFGSVYASGDPFELNRRMEENWQPFTNWHTEDGVPLGVPLPERAFPKLPNSIREVRIRADAAFFDHQIVRFIEGKRACSVIVARLTRPVKNRLSVLRYRRVASDVWAGEFQYGPHGWPGPPRFVVIRRPVPEEPSAQLTLFQRGGYSYQALVTHLTLQPLNLWRFTTSAHGRS